jgi:hypothetical protein
VIHAKRGLFDDFVRPSLTYTKLETFQDSITQSFLIDPVIKKEFDTGFTPASFWM